MFPKGQLDLAAQFPVTSKSLTDGTDRDESWKVE